MERMGYGEQPYVVFLHEDIDRKHIHIVSSRVNAEGVKIAHSYERRRSEDIRKELEKKYCLKTAGYREGTTLPLKKIDYQRGNIRAQAGSIIISALEQYRFSTFGEFNALLRCYNLTAQEVSGVAGKDNKPYRGLVYGALDGEGQRVGNPIKASRIGDYASLRNIEKRCGENSEYLKDLDRRKVLSERIRKVVSACRVNGDVSQTVIERKLFEIGISPVFRTNEEGRLIGATFIDHKNKNVYNGSNLSKDLSANAWHKLFTDPKRQEYITLSESESHTEERLRQVSEVIRDNSSENMIQEAENADNYVDYFEYDDSREEFVSDQNGSSKRDYYYRSDGLGIIEDLAFRSDNFDTVEDEYRRLYKHKTKKRKKRLK
jgi:hypothetical protein